MLPYGRQSINGRSYIVYHVWRALGLRRPNVNEPSPSRVPQGVPPARRGAIGAVSLATAALVTVVLFISLKVTQAFEHHR
jgi:hypothetical protein